jgi:hypothetical protein
LKKKDGFIEGQILKVFDKFRSQEGTDAHFLSFLKILKSLKSVRRSLPAI